MSTLSDSDIKQQVREHYGAIARGAADGCAPTGPAGAVTCCAPSSDVVELVSYDALAEGVVDGANLGLGCGLPTRSADLQPGQTVLDLGSGAGIDVFLAAQAVGPMGRVIGVDMTPDMLARARANAARAGYANVEFRQGEIEALPVAADSVDVVLSNCVINLVPDKRQAFREIWRVLKPGGAFTISDMVTFGPVPDALRADMALWAGCVAGALDRDEYLEIIRAVGFRNVRVQEESTYDPESIGVDAPDPAEAFGIASVTVVGEKP